MRQILRPWLKTITLLSLVILLAASAIIAVKFLVKPILNKYIITRAQHYGIQFSSQDIQLNGAIHLTNVHIKLRNGGQLTIADLVARPNFSFISGYARAKQLIYSKDKLQIRIASLAAKNIRHHYTKHDPKFFIGLNNTAKLLYKYNIGSIDLSDGHIYLDYRKTNNLFNFNKLKFYNLNNAKIGKLVLSTLQARITPNEIDILAGLDYLEARQFDLGYALDLCSGQASNSSISKVLWKSLELQNIKATKLNPEQNIIDMRLSQFVSGPFYLKKLPPELRDILAQIKQENNQQAIIRAVKLIANTVTKADATLKNLYLNLPNIEINAEQALLLPARWDGLVPKQLTAAFDKLILQPKNLAASFTKKTGYPPSFSGRLKFNYNEQSELFSLNPLEFSANKLCKLYSTLELSNVATSLFSAEPNMSALDTILFKQAYLNYIDHGLVPSLITILSEATELPETEIKDLVYTFLEKTPALLIQDPITAQQIANSLKDLAEKPQSIKITLSTKNSSGIAIKDAIDSLQQTPPSLNDRFNFHFESKTL